MYIPDSESKIGSNKVTRYQYHFVTDVRCIFGELVVIVDIVVDNNQWSLMVLEFVLLVSPSDQRNRMGP